MHALTQLQFCHSACRSGLSRRNYGVSSGIFLTAILWVVILSCLAASGQNIINTVAGGAPSTGTATSSDLAGPSAVIEDASGNIYVSSPMEQWVYKMNAGQLSIYAGTGYIADHYQPGPANKDPLWSPFALAIDKQGNIYIADTGNNVVRVVNAAGTQSVIAGDSQPCPSPADKCGDDGPALKAKLNGPLGVAVDSNGNVYIADTGDNRVRVMNLTTGIIKPFAGNYNEAACSPSTATCGDGGPAGHANVNGPIGLAVDSKNNVYIADAFDHRIRMVKKGIISTVAGNGTVCFPSTGLCGDGGAATSANLHAPQGVYVDAKGNIYIADTADNRIRLVTAGTTPTITTFAGTGVVGFNGDGTATSVQLARPLAVYVDKAENVLIGDSGNQRVREVTAGNLKTIIGSPTPNGGDNGPATASTLASPYTVAVDSANNYFIADQANNRVREVNVTTQIITTVAGNGNANYSGDGGPATSATLDSLSGLAVDGSENLYIADTGNRVVRCVAGVTGACVGATGGVAAGDINTVVGFGHPCTPSTGACGDGGPAYDAWLTAPTSVAIDSAGNLFIADPSSNKIRVVSNGIMETIAGTGGSCGWTGDGGPANEATLCDPHGIALDASDDVYIADAGNNVIRCVLGVVGGCGDSAHKYAVGDIITYAYNGKEQFFQNEDGHLAKNAQRWAANEVAVDSRGNLFVGGGNDELVQRVDLATGIIVTVAGRDTQWYYYGFSGDGGSATKAHIDNLGLAIDSHEDLLIGDAGNNRIREVPLVAVGTPSPTTLAFGNVAVGTSSQPQPVTLTNTGSDDLAISNVSTSIDFTQTNNCASVLAPSQSCTIQVTFTPNKKGALKGTLTVTHDGFKGVTKVPLSGTGV
jgi:hypothetical protein